MPVASDHRQAAAPDRRNPIEIKGTERNLWNQRVPNVNHVAACNRQSLTKPERTLIDEEANAGRIDGHA